jgi:hypothetical protein
MVGLLLLIEAPLFGPFSLPIRYSGHAITISFPRPGPGTGTRGWEMTVTETSGSGPFCCWHPDLALSPFLGPLTGPTQDHSNKAQTSGMSELVASAC